MTKQPIPKIIYASDYDPAATLISDDFDCVVSAVNKQLPGYELKFIRYDEYERIKNERDQLRAENKQLKSEIGKMNRRIKQLEREIARYKAGEIVHDKYDTLSTKVAQIETGNVKWNALFTAIDEGFHS